jgi:hypothetical protein
MSCHVANRHYRDPGQCDARRRCPKPIRSDNGAEMTAERVRGRLAKLGTRTLYIEPSSPAASCATNA